MNPSSKLRSSAWRIARIVVLAYLGICLLMVAMETQLVYPVPGQADFVSDVDAPRFEAVWFTSADGTKIHGLFCPAENSQRAVLVCHGNAEDVPRNAGYIDFLSDQLTANVFVFDYRGYGKSEGKPHEAGIMEDSLAAQRWLAERIDVEPDEVFLLGQSIGGSIAVGLASRQGAAGVVVINAFADMAELAADIYPWLPVRWLMRNRYPARDWIADYEGPLLQFHGTEDTIIPLASGKELFAAAPTEDKHFVELPDANHNTPLPGHVFDRIRQFMDRVQPLDSTK